MNHLRFDAANAVSFDLGSGQVDVGRRARALIPVSALEALCDSAGAEAARDFGRLVGTEIGGRVTDRITADSASAEVVVEHLGGEIALLGLGSLGLERWGAVLVLTVSTCPFAASADGWIAGVFEGALQRVMGRVVHAVELPRQLGTVRVLLAGDRAAELARRAIQSGKGLGDLTAELNGLGGHS